VLLVALLVWTPGRGAAFWLLLVSLAMLIIVQLLFWTMTQSVNRFWWENTETGTTIQRLFGTVSGERQFLIGRWCLIVGNCRTFFELSPRRSLWS
jgi:hypothetical protein